MSYVDAIYQKEKDLINLVERVDGVRKYRSFPAHYQFYYADPKGQYTAIGGERLSKVAVASHKARRDMRKASVSALRTEQCS